MKKLILLLFLLLLLGQQTPYLPLHYGFLDLSVPLLLTIGLWGGPVKGLVWGFLVGLLQASLSGYLIGTFLLTRSLIGWGGGMLQGLIVKDNPWAVSLTAFWASILNDAIFLLSSPHPLSRSWLFSLACKGITSAFLAPFFSFLMRKVYGDRETLFY